MEIMKFAYEHWVLTLVFAVGLCAIIDQIGDAVYKARSPHPKAEEKED